MNSYSANDKTGARDSADGGVGVRGDRRLLAHLSGRNPDVRQEAGDRRNPPLAALHVTVRRSKEKVAKPRPWRAAHTIVTVSIALGAAALAKIATRELPLAAVEESEALMFDLP